jgi:molybdate transport system ATP-binding protein
MLEVTARIRLGELDVDVDWRVKPEMTAVVGPSGAGKSTLLQMIAGLTRPSSGTVRWKGRVLDDRGEGIHVPPEKRRFGYVFQESRLFPHLDVEQNLRYSPHVDHGAIQFDDVVSELGLSELLARRTGALSGGERQRVALGRSLLSNPELLLLDEPVSALDLPVRLRFMDYLRRVQSAFEIPTVFVSHDPELVAHFASDVAVMTAGRLESNGPAMVAPDVNLFRGVLHMDGSVPVVAVGDTRIRVAHTGLADGSDVWLRLPANDPVLMVGAPEAMSARNVIAGVVREVRRDTDRTVIVIDAGPSWFVHVVESTVSDLALEPGREVSLVAKATSFQVIAVDK